MLQSNRTWQLNSVWKRIFSCHWNYLRSDLFQHLGCKCHKKGLHHHLCTIIIMNLRNEGELKHPYLLPYLLFLPSPALLLWFRPVLLVNCYWETCVEMNCQKMSRLGSHILSPLQTSAATTDEANDWKITSLKHLNSRRGSRLRMSTDTVSVPSSPYDTTENTLLAH